MSGLFKTVGLLLVISLTWLVPPSKAYPAQEAGVRPLSDRKEPQFDLRSDTPPSGRDPFAPSEEEVKIEPEKKETIPPPPPRDLYADLIRELKVSAIIRGRDSEMAIINGCIVHKDDRIQEFIIKRIEADRVVLSAGNKDYYLILDALVPGFVPEKKGE